MDQNCKFHDPGGWGSDVRAWPYNYSDYVVSSTISIYSTFVAIMMLLSYTIIDFHLCYDGAIDIQI